LSLSIESLNKMVSQQTKILEYHEKRLDDHDATLEVILKKIKNGPPEVPKKTSAAPTLPKDRRAEVIIPGNPVGVTQIIQPLNLSRFEEK
jgi:hypothetical protein